MLKKKAGQNHEEKEIRHCLDDPATVYFYDHLCGRSAALYGGFKLCTAKGRTWSGVDLYSGKL